MAVTDSPPNGGNEEKNVGVPAYVSNAGNPDYGSLEGPKLEEDWRTRNGLSLNSFKKRSYGHGIVELDRTMKPRHLHMIAIGGSIGAGFFVGSGSALRQGGPGFLLIDFMIMGIMIFNVAFALGELAIMYPVTGGFYTYSARFIDPSWGFAMGWNYVFQWLIVVPLELTVCAISISYWDDQTTPAAWITLFWGFLIIINIFGTLGYAEEEFWASSIKLTAIVVFMIICFVLVLGGGPAGGRYDQYWGARLWYEPGAFANGFKGFCSVFVTAAFSFSGTELVGLAAAETPNPAKSLPSAIRQVFWRITLFYVLGLFFVGLLVAHNDDALLDASSNNPAASPFVLVGKYAGLPGFDHFMNVIILISVISIGVSGVYGGSRTLTGLAQQGYAPKIFTYVDRSGRPLPSVAIHLLFGALAYMTLSAGGNVVFNWFLSLSGLAALFTWGSICYAHIRFRQAWAYHGHTLDEIPFQAVGGVYGSWCGLGLIILVLIFALYTSISPIGQDLNTAEGFFQSYLAIFVVAVFWVIGYAWKRTGWLKLSEIDVDTGRRQLDMQLIADYRAHVAAMPTWRRIMHNLF